MLKKARILSLFAFLTLLSENLTVAQTVEQKRPANFNGLTGGSGALHGTYGVTGYLGISPSASLLLGAGIGITEDYSNVLLAYQVGLKFFPDKRQKLYLSVSYGVVGTMYGYYYDGWVKHESEKVLYGPTGLIGYQWPIGKRNILEVGIGVSYYSTCFFEGTSYETKDSGTMFALDIGYGIRF